MLGAQRCSRHTSRKWTSVWLVCQCSLPLHPEICLLITATLCRVKSAADASASSGSGAGVKRPAEGPEAHSPSKQARVASAAYPTAYSAPAPAPQAAPVAPVASAASYYGQPAAGYQYPGYAYPGYGQPGYPTYSYSQY